MALKDVFKVNRKTFFNPVAWLNLKEIAANTRYIIDTIKTGFKTPDKPEKAETFEEAVQRQNLSEDDVAQTAATFQLYKLIFAVCAIFSFFSSFYFLIHYRTFAGFLLALAVTLVFSVQMFRFSFLLFQIKKRKLGCTFQEWWQG